MQISQSQASIEPALSQSGAALGGWHGGLRKGLGGDLAVKMASSAAAGLERAGRDSPRVLRYGAGLG